MNILYGHLTGSFLILNPQKVDYTLTVFNYYDICKYLYFRDFLGKNWTGFARLPEYIAY